MVSIKTEGEVTLKDVEAYLDDLVVNDAMLFAKLFDASDLIPVTDDYELLMLGARMRAYAQTMGSGNLAQANRPVGVFFTVEGTKEWLTKQPRWEARSVASLKMGKRVGPLVSSRWPWASCS